MTRPFQIPLLIVSIGNPSLKYTDTLHSAGHTVLTAIQSILWHSHTSFRPYHGGDISTAISAQSAPTRLTWRGVVPLNEEGREQRPDDERDWTLWKSGSLMNISGAGVGKVLKLWRREDQRRANLGRLVVLHDELERDLGELRLSEGKASARGHNGIKSIQAALGGTPFWRIGLGIGRPQSREPKDVAEYVLRKMTAREKRSLKEAAHPVLRMLERLSESD